MFQKDFRIILDNQNQIFYTFKTIKNTDYELLRRITDRGYIY